MNRIKFLALLRAVRNEAAKFGFHGDLYADVEDVPLVGTLQQQFAIVAIRAGINLQLTNESERRLLSRLVRAAVLTSPTGEFDDDARTSKPDVIERANLKAIAYRRRQQRRAPL